MWIYVWVLVWFPWSTRPFLCQCHAAPTWGNYRKKKQIKLKASRKKVKTKEISQVENIKISESKEISESLIKKEKKGIFVGRRQNLPVHPGAAHWKLRLKGRSSWSQNPDLGGNGKREHNSEQGELASRLKDRRWVFYKHLHNTERASMFTLTMGRDTAMKTVWSPHPSVYISTSHCGSWITAPGGWITALLPDELLFYLLHLIEWYL